MRQNQENLLSPPLSLNKERYDNKFYITFKLFHVKCNVELAIRQVFMSRYKSRSIAKAILSVFVNKTRGVCFCQECKNPYRENCKTKKKEIKVATGSYSMAHGSKNHPQPQSGFHPHGLWVILRTVLLLEAIRGFAPITPVPPTARNRAGCFVGVALAARAYFWHCPKVTKGQCFSQYLSLTEDFKDLGYRIRSFRILAHHN